jgi:hypothetical protein
MKKIVALTLALILALSLAACGGDGGSSGGSSSGGGSRTSTPRPSNTAPGDNGDNGSSSDDPAPGDDGKPDGWPGFSGDNGGGELASLIGWMLDGTYSYDFTMTMEGPEGGFEASGSMAADGDRFAQSQEMVVGGMRVKQRVIQRDGKMYTIDDENKYYLEMPVEAYTPDVGVTDYTGIKKIGSGTGDINGRRLPYEDYSMGTADSEVRFYVDGKDVYAIVTEVEGYKTTIIISNPSNRVPAGVFDLPAGYTDMGAMFGGGYAPGGYPSGDFDINDYLPDGFNMDDYLNGFDFGW